MIVVIHLLSISLHKNLCRTPYSDVQFLLRSPPIRTHGLKHTNKQSYNQGDQSFISILDYP